MPSGRHRLPSPALANTRRVVGSPIGITAMVVALITVIAIAVPVGMNAFGCSDPRYMRVSTTQSMAPVLRDAASEFNAGNPSYNGECVYAQVDEIAPHRIMTALAGGQPDDSTIAPDVWVPESSAWVELARISAGGAHGIQTDPPSLASSPVVMSVPEGAEGLSDSGDAAWTTLLPDARDPDRPVVMVDPNRGADGMTAMHAIRDHLGTGDDADTAMTDFVRDVQQDSAFGEIDLDNFYTGSEDGGVDPLVVAPEQAVAAYNESRNEGAPELAALYPNEGTVNLDYPYVTTTEDSTFGAAADDLYEVLRDGEAYRTQLQELGFRDPDGQAPPVVDSQSGLAAEEPDVHGDLTGDSLMASVTDWNRLSMPSQAMVLADTSEHMEEDLNGGPARIEVAQQAAMTGLNLFPDETEMGVWLMSDQLGENGREEAADLHELGASDDDDVTRRQELVGVAEGIEVEGGESRLYDNILDAFTVVEDEYDEDKINSVILLTSGRDDGSSDISHEDLVAALQDRFDPERPVSMFIIAFGAQAEEDELQQIAAATSGSLFVTDDPDEVGDIFMSSISRRLCVPDCD